MVSLRQQGLEILMSQIREYRRKATPNEPAIWTTENGWQRVDPRAMDKVMAEFQEKKALV